MALSIVARASKKQLGASLTAFARNNATGPGYQQPDYLDALKPPHPVHDLIDVSMKSHDFPSLERLGSFVHRTAEYMGLNVEESWATPAQVVQVRTYKPKSKVLDHEYKLSLYERNVQISDFRCSLLPIFVEIVRSNLPEGTRLSIHPHGDEHDAIRYIPDIELIGLKGQLDDLTKPVDPKP